MPAFINEKGKAVLVTLALIIFAVVGLFVFLRDAETYQLKRVVRGNYTLDTTTEVASVNINTTDKLNGDTLNTSSSFIISSRMCIDD